MFSIILTSSHKPEDYFTSTLLYFTLNIFILKHTNNISKIHRSIYFSKSLNGLFNWIFKVNILLWLHSIMCLESIWTIVKGWMRLHCTKKICKITIIFLVNLYSENFWYNGNNKNSCNRGRLHELLLFTYLYIKISWNTNLLEKSFFFIVYIRNLFFVFCIFVNIVLYVHVHSRMHFTVV